MFKINDNPTFTHVVEVDVPVNLGFEKQTFKATFRVMPVSELEAHDTSTVEGSSRWLKAVIVGLGDLVGPDGQPLSYNETVRDKLLDIGFVRVALSRTYTKAVNKAAVGN